MMTTDGAPIPPKPTPPPLREIREGHVPPPPPYPPPSPDAVGGTSVFRRVVKAVLGVFA
jgi:hypothetical protein